MATVYIIQNIETGMIYIGSTTNILKARLGNHKRNLRSGKHGNPILQASYNKYGDVSFEYDILEDGISDNDILSVETFWIEYFRYIGAKLYNICHPANTRKGIPMPEDAKQKLSIINTGKTLTQEHKDRIGTANRGNKSNVGKTWSAEVRSKMSDGSSKTYDGVVSPDGIVYSPITNLNKFCKEHNLDRRGMAYVVAGKRPHWHGWTRYNPEEKKAA